MLVSVTLTLLLVLAVVQIFQALGDSVSLGRATIEMSGELRSVASAIQSNLDATTCPLAPPINDGQGLGFLYYEEGPANDATLLSDSDANGEWDDPSLTHYGDVDDILSMTIKSGSSPFKGKIWVASSDGGAPQQFDVRSEFAEVVWWVATEDINGDGDADPEEPQMLLRRVFLVNPTIQTKFDNKTEFDEDELGIATPVERVIYDPHTMVQFGSDEVPTAAMWSTGVSLRKAINETFATPNSLSDLSDPRNRSVAFYGSEHQVSAGVVRLRNRNLVTSNNSFVGFPRVIPVDDYLPPAEPSVAGTSFDASQYDATPGDMGEFGQFVVLNDILAFDVRIFDPRAPILRLRAEPSAPVLTPGDPGFYGDEVGGIEQIRIARFSTSSQYAEVGQGAFVDLGYLVDRLNILSNSDSETAAIGRPLVSADLGGSLKGRMSSFSGLPSFKDSVSTGNFQFVDDSSETRFWPSIVDQIDDGDTERELGGSLWDWDPNEDRPIFAYDTWTTFFEHDGISQDDDNNDGIIDLPGQPDPVEQAPVALATPRLNMVDEGRDGLDVPTGVGGDGIAGTIDDPGAFGIDDASELESPAPYPVPARGIEVRIRMWDVSTGQVRQVSVVGDFTN